MAETPNKSLPLYDAAVPPDLIGTYNKAMGILDAETSGGGGEGEWTDAVITREIDLIDTCMTDDSHTKFKVIHCNMLVIVQFYNSTFVAPHENTLELPVAQNLPLPLDIVLPVRAPGRNDGIIDITRDGYMYVHNHNETNVIIDISNIQMVYLTDEEVS